MNIEDDELKANIEELNKQSELYKNQIEDMKKKCYEEMNQKYSEIIQKKIEEIHKTIYKDVQEQNQKILDGYVQKFEELERQREENYSSLSKIMLSNVQGKEGDFNISAVKTTHYGIVCKKCNMNPIKGYRYKCSVCKDYNLCERCEEKNYETQEHQHDFIKMRNEEKKEEHKKKDEKKEKEKEKEEIIIENKEVKQKKAEKKQEKKQEKQPPKKIEYIYELEDKNPERYNKTLFKESIEDAIFEFNVVNKSSIDFPKGGKTKIITDRTKSNIIIGDIAIQPETGLKPGDSAKIHFIVEKKHLDIGVKKIHLDLNIDGKKIGQPIILSIHVKSKFVEEFRNDFNLSEKDYDDFKLYALLQKHKFKKEEAFSSMFNN